MKYCKPLDGLRGIGILLILMAHFGVTLMNWAWFMIPMFFTLSGYLITEILLEQKQHRAGVFFRNFYARRTLRIFPVYFLYLAVIFTFSVFNRHFDTSIAPYLFTYTYNFSYFFHNFQPSHLFTHLWSLCVEEHFYLVWPFAVYFLPQKKLKAVILFLILCSPLLRLALGQIAFNPELEIQHRKSVVYANTFSYLDTFAFGAAVSVFNLPQKIKRTKLLFTGLVTAMIVTGIMLSGFAQALNPGNLTFGFPVKSMDAGRHIWAYSLIAVLAVLLIVITIQNSQSNTFWNKFMSNPALMYMGKLSYGAYVLHNAVIFCLKPMIGRDAGFPVQAVFFAAYLAIVFGLATVSYYGFEIFFLRLKERFNVSKNTV